MMSATAAPQLADLADAVCRRVGVTARALTGAGRSSEAMRARRLYAFMARYHLGASITAIARHLDCAPRTVHRLLEGYTDAAGRWQPGARALAQGDLQTMDDIDEIRRSLDL